MSPLTGIRCFVAGLQRLHHPAVRRYVLAPALVSLVIIGFGLTVVFSYINDLSLYLQHTLPAWLALLNVILAPLLYLLGILVGMWVFGLLAIIVGSPFLGGLAAHVSEDLHPGSLAATQLQPWWQQLGPALCRELRKLRYHLPRLLGLLLLGLIPGINVIAPLLWLGFGAWMMAVQFCDYTSENRGEAFTTTLQRLRSQRGAALGFGACVTVAMAIPLINFLVVPVAAIGATVLMHQMDNVADVSHDINNA